MTITYKEEGFDISDDGDQAKQLVDSLDVQLAIRKLPKQQQEILQMIIGGYTFREITTELGISNREIMVAKKALCAKLN
jgi:DNA-binding NarL/FixJ family response regulator